MLRLFQLLLLSALLPNAECLAQWGTVATWPAPTNTYWSHPGWRLNISECNEGLNERWRAADQTVNWTHYFRYTNSYWMPKLGIQRIANRVIAIAPQYINIEATRTSATNDFDAYFATTNNAAIEHWTGTGLVASVSATTSIYFAAQSGGAWDFFSYNNYAETLDEIKAALNKLTEMSSASERLVLSGPDGSATNEVSGDAGNPGEVTWAGAKAMAETNTTLSATMFPSLAEWTYGNLNAVPRYRAEWVGRYPVITITMDNSATTDEDYASDVYIYARVDVPYRTGPPDTNLFHAQGSGLRSNLYTLAFTDAGNTLTVRPIGPIGDTNTVFNKAWVAEPTGAGDTIAQGYSTSGNSVGDIDEFIAVVDYAVTNGFKYVP